MIRFFSSSSFSFPICRWIPSTLFLFISFTLILSINSIIETSSIYTQVTAQLHTNSPNHRDTHSSSTSSSSLPVYSLPISSWSYHEIESWLSSLSLSQYLPQLSSFEGNRLVELKNDELAEIGIKVLGHRKKLLKSIETLKHQQNHQDYQYQHQHQLSDQSSNLNNVRSVSFERQPNTSPVCENASTENDCELNDIKVDWIGVRSLDEDQSSNNWYEEPYPHQYDTKRCTIDKVSRDKMTKSLFRSKYYLKKPVIITPTKHSAIPTLLVRKHWTRSYIIQHVGHIDVNLGTPHSLTAYGDGVLKTTLGIYIEDLRNISLNRVSADHYLFDRRGFFALAPALLTSYQPFQLFHWDNNGEEYGREDAMTFALGPTGSGINFHYHKNAWNEVLFGRKRWFLYPPTIGTPPNGYNQFQPALDWYLINYNTLNNDQLPYECVQYPGEIMYVPEDWYHATINIGETLAVVGQAKLPSLNTLMMHVLAGLDLGEKDKKEGLSHFNSALSISPNHPQVFNYIGNLYKTHQDLSTAIKYYKKAVESNPLYAMAHLSLGQSYLALNQFEQAHTSLYSSYLLNPNYFETLLDLGNLHYLTNQQDQAIIWLERAASVGKEEKRTNAIVNLCSIYTLTEQPEKCLLLAEERLKKYSSEWYVWTVYAQAMMAIGEQSKAKIILKDVVKKNNNNFPPAQNLLNQILKEEEEEYKRRGIQPNETDREEESEEREEEDAFKNKTIPQSTPVSLSAPFLHPPSSFSSPLPSSPSVSQTRKLKLVTSYSLSSLFPHTISSINLSYKLITYPPILNDPIPPVFIGPQHTQTERLHQCQSYMESRVISGPFSATVWNTWMRSTSGHLFGELLFHQIKPQTELLNQLSLPRGHEENSVFVAWDGQVFTSTHFFSYESLCVAGIYCILEELHSMKLIKINEPGSTNIPTPTSSSSSLSSLSNRRFIEIDSIGVFSGSVFSSRYTKIANPKDFGLGIKVDHTAKNHKLFQNQINQQNLPLKPPNDAIIYDLPLPSHIQSSCLIRRIHLPSIVVIDQFMTGVNFAHFMTEVLPKLSFLLINQFFHRYPSTYLLMQHQSFTEEVINRLNIDKSRIVYTHPCLIYSADIVYQPTPLPLDMPTKQTIQMIREAINISKPHSMDGSKEEIKKFGSSQPQREAKSLLLNSTSPILISLFRPSPLTRSISNSKQIEQLLKKMFPTLPFVSFDPEFYTFNEAISLFKRAKVLIGVVGAGFANMAFISPELNPVMFQLVPTVTHHRIPCGVTPWWHYAELMGVKVRSMTIEGMGFDESDWEVPEKELSKFLHSWKSLVK